MSRSIERLFRFSTASAVTQPPLKAARKLQRASRLLSLEQRFMFDGAAVAAAADAVHAHAVPDSAVHAALAEGPAPTAVREADPSANHGRKEVVFVDTSVTDYKALEAAIGAGIEIQEIDHGQSGLAQIAQWATTHEGYDAIHILGHGTEAMLFIGSDALSAAKLSDTTVRNELAEIGHALKAGGDVLVYGCDVAAGSTGADWVAQFAAAIGADVAASTDDTGAAAHGGNWTLEAQVGQVDTASPFDAVALQAYSGLLTTFDLTGATGNGTTVVQQTVSGATLVITGTQFIQVATDGGAGDLAFDYGNVSGNTIWAGQLNGRESQITLTVAGNRTFDLASFSMIDIAGDMLPNLTITTDKGNQALSTDFNNGPSGLEWDVAPSGAMYQGITYATFTTVSAPYSNTFNWVFDNFVLNNISPAGPTVTDAKISISGASGTGGAYKIGDTVTATWNNTGAGDNNAGITGVTVDFSQFGGGAAVVATESSGTWTASYTITAGSIDLTNRNVSVSATSAAGTTTTADTTNATVDNVAPTVSDGRISISGGSGTGGAYKIGDTVTATWNNTAGGDNNSDTISSVTADFSAFGGGAAVAASNSGGTWTATYTIVSGAIDGSNRNVSVTATDNAGNTRTTADTTNATVDSVTPTVTNANISISGASGTGGAYKIGDTVTATWNNTAGGDNNSDTISSATVDFSAFGGGSAVVASNSAGTWTATYTIVAGAIDGTNRNVSVTATDNAGNTTTTADTTNATVDSVAPTVTNANISISGASGTGGAYKIGDTVTATWNNTAGGDNNSDTISSATVDFSAFGGGSAVSASNSSGTWTATYTIVAGAIDGTNRNVSVTATDNAGNTTTTADTTNATVDSVAPTVTDANISISGGSGTGGAYKVGDTVTATWNNTAGGDNNSDTISGVTVDFSAFGGGAAVAASNSSGTWTATYTLVAGAIDGLTNRNVSVTVTDNAGNTTTTADTTNATVDNVAPSITFSSIALSADTGSSASDFITNTAAQTITATLSGAPGGTDIVYGSIDNGATWTDITSKVSGTTLTWDGVTLTSSSTLKFKVTDATGNDGTTASQAYTLDTTAPSTPSTPNMAAGTDTGTSNTDDITSDNTPNFIGTAAIGSTVTLYDTDGTTVLGTVTANGAGNWLITSSALSAGSHTLTAKATDTAGNVSSASSGLTVVIDTAAPTGLGLDNTTIVTSTATAAATIATLSATDGQAITYSLATGNGTNDADNGSFAISGTSLQVGGSSLSAGTYKIYVAATDAAGNVANQAFTLTLVDAPSVSSIVRTGGASSTVSTSATSVSYTVTFSESVTGVDATDFSLTATGTASGNVASLSGSGTTYTVTVDTISGDGTLRLDLNNSGTGIQNGGTVSIVGGYTSGSTYTLDHTAPSAPSTPDMTSGTDSGLSNSDNITSDTTPTFTGTAESGSTVTLYDTDGTTVLGTTTATGGNWSITSSTLSEGSHTLTVKATDAAGNVSSASSSLSTTIDASAPTVSSVSVPSNGTYKAGDTLSFTVNLSEAVTVDTGGGTPQIALTVGGSTVYASYASGSGSSALVFTYTAQAGDFDANGITVGALQSNGATLRDAAGNDTTLTLNSVGSTASVNVDGIAPSVNSVSVPTNGNYAAGTNLDFTVSFDEAVTVDATGGTPRIALTIGGTTVYADYLSGSGTSSVVFRHVVQAGENDADGIAIGALSLNGGTLRDSAGNNATLTLNSVASTAAVVVDTTAPTTTVATVAFSADTGASNTDFITQTAAQTISGTLSANLVSGETVEVSLDNGATWTTATTSVGQNTWSLAGQTLAASDTLKVRVLDTAGNSGTVLSQAYVLDTTAPTTTVATAAFSADTGTSSTDFITRTAAQTISGTLSANLVSGEAVEVSLDNGATWTTATASVGQNTWSLAGQTLTASDTLKVRVTDSAGNSGTAFSQAYVLDTTAPTTTVASVAFSADTGTSSTDFITNTAAQTISGTLSANLASGETVLVSLDNGATWTTATATVGQNTWSLAGQTLTASDTLRVKVTDAAGNDGTVASQAYVLDTTGPGITFSNLALSADTGASASDFITSTAAQTLTATLSGAPAGTDIVYGSLDNGATWTDITNKVSGTTLTWNGVTLAGSNTIRLKVTDVVGNDGTVASQAYVLDTTAPTTTVASTAFSADTGTSSTDFITTTAAQTISGTLSANLAAGETVYVSLDNGATWTAAAASVGQSTWSLAGQTLAASDTLKVKVTDTAGNDGSVASQAYVLDTTAPGITFSNLALSADTGTSNTDFITHTAAQTVTATLSGAPAGTDIVYGSVDNGATWTDITNKVSGTTLTWNGVTLTGSSTLRLKVTDAAGNDGTVASQAYVLDTTGPGITFSNLALSADTGTSASDFITSTAAQTLTATLSGAPAGTDIVYGSLDNGATWTDITNKVSGTTLTWNGVTLAGSNTIRLKVTDVVGNDGTVASQAYVLDTTAPAAPTLEVVTTSSTTPTLSGVASLNGGETMTVTVDGAVYAVTPSGGHWSLDLATAVPTSGTLALTPGRVFDVTLGVVDAAGNAQSVSSQLNVLAPPTAVLPTDPAAPPAVPVPVPVVEFAPVPEPVSTTFLSPATASLVSVPLGADAHDTLAAATPDTRSLQDNRSIATQPSDSGLTQGGRGAFPVVVVSSAQGTQDGLMLLRGLPNQAVAAAGTVEITVPSDAFGHTDPNALIQLSARQANGQPLPNWVVFDPREGKFTVRAPKGVTGELSIRVIARDAKGHEAATTFKLRVGGTAANRAAIEPSGRTGLSQQIRVASAERQAPAGHSALGRVTEPTPTARAAQWSKS